nr:MAG TPA: hypothetical protein [Caudoviricetes sp.]
MCCSCSRLASRHSAYSSYVMPLSTILKATHSTYITANPIPVTATLKQLLVHRLGQIVASSTVITHSQTSHTSVIYPSFLIHILYKCCYLCIYFVPLPTHRQHYEYTNPTLEFPICKLWRTYM